MDRGPFELGALIFERLFLVFALTCTMVRLSVFFLQDLFSFQVHRGPFEPLA